MIVDDSLTVRTIFKRMVESDPALMIAGTASSAERAIAHPAIAATDVGDVVLGGAEHHLGLVAAGALAQLDEEFDPRHHRHVPVE